MRLILAVIMVVVSLISYYSKSEFNPITKESQHTGGMTKEQETALGLKAVPEMERQYGGEVNDPQKRGLVESVGRRIVQHSDAGKSAYHFDFHLLNDDKTINAFALPGGQVFMTSGLFNKLSTEGELAGVLGHEITHVVARHSAQQLSKQQLTQGIASAAVIASSDPNDPNHSQRNAALAMAVAQLCTLKYDRNDESQADQYGVLFMSQAGYDPRSMLKVMEVLEKSEGGHGPPEFFSTHPNPRNRMQRIEAAIQRLFPDGVPSNLEK